MNNNINLSASDYLIRKKERNMSGYIESLNKVTENITLNNSKKNSKSFKS